VRFATSFGFRPDFCEAADPESKGVVEALCGYVQRDLVVPAEGWVSEADANDACPFLVRRGQRSRPLRDLGVPDDRLREERALFRLLPSLRPPLRRGVARRVDKLCCVRIGSARYSVPREPVGRVVTVIAAEGEV